MGGHLREGPSRATRHRCGDTLGQGGSRTKGRNSDGTQRQTHRDRDGLVSVKTPEWLLPPPTGRPWTPRQDVLRLGGAGQLLTLPPGPSCGPRGRGLGLNFALRVPVVDVAAHGSSIHSCRERRQKG